MPDTSLNWNTENVWLLFVFVVKQKLESASKQSIYWNTHLYVVKLFSSLADRMSEINLYEIHKLELGQEKDNMIFHFLYHIYLIMRLFQDGSRFLQLFEVINPS